MMEILELAFSKGSDSKLLMKFEIADERFPHLVYELLSYVLMEPELSSIRMYEVFVMVPILLALLSAGINMI